MRLYYGALDLTAFPYSIEFGMDTGAPQNLYEAYQFLLQDGSVVLSDRADNRTMGFTVLVEGPDLAALADAEAALLAESEKPLNTITIDPEDFGPPSVYQTYRGQVSLARDDDFEMNRLRRYTVSVQAMPFVRSVDEVVTPALPASGSTTTTVNDGSSTTGWTGAVNGTTTAPTISSGAVKVSDGSAALGSVTVSATLAGPIDTSSTKFIPVDWKPEQYASGIQGLESLRAFGDGVELARVAERSSPTAGFVRTTFQVDSSVSTIASLRLDSLTCTPNAGTPDYDGAAPTVRSLYVDNVSRTDVRPSLGTARQLLRVVTVDGSAPRQPAAVMVEHATDALGDAMIFVYPNTAVGYQPCLRPYRVVGGATTTTDATLVSGARDAINGATATFDIPVSQLVPGGHGLVVRVSSDNPDATAATLSWTASTRVGSAAMAVTDSGSRDVTLSGNYSILALDRLNLPTVDVSASSATNVVRITITATSAAGVNLDEAWLFNREIGTLVGPVACGTGTAAVGGPARRLFALPPSVATPRPRVLVGHSADRSDAFYPAGSQHAWDLLVFGPGENNILTVMTNALDADVSLRHYDWWHTNAAK